MKAQTAPRWVIILVALFTLSFGILAMPANASGFGLSSSPFAAAQGSAVNLNAEMAKQLSEVNAYRASRGLRPFVRNGEKDRRAQNWANFIAQRAANSRGSAANVFYQIGHEGDYARRNPAYRYTERYEAENMFMCQTPQRLRQSVSAFRSSPGHNANLLIPGGNPPEIGIGIAYVANSSNGYPVWVVVYKMK